MTGMRGIWVVVWAGYALAQAPVANAPADRGTSLHHAGDCRTAIADLQSNTDAHAQALLASCELDVGDYKAAAGVLEPLVAKSPDDAAALGMLATAYERDGRAPEAVTKLTAFLKDHDSDTAAHIRLARAYLAAGDAGHAGDELKLVDAQQPNNPAAVAVRADIALSEKRFQDAIDLFHQAEKAVHGDLEIENGLASAYLGLDHCDQAVTPLEAAQDASPLDYGIAKKLAGCYRKLEQWPKVIDALRTTTAQEAEDQEATGWMLEAYSHLKRTPDSEEYLRWAIGLAPKNLRARIALGDLLYDGNKLTEASVEYVEAVRLNPTLAEINFRLGVIAEKEKKLDQARKYYEAASGTPAATVEMHQELARVCLDAGDLACAKTALDRISADHMTPAAARMRLQIEYKSGNWQEVAKQSAALRAQGEQDAALLKMAAEAEIQLKHFPEAADLYEHALTQNANDREVCYKLAEIYSDNEELGKSTRAVEILKGYTDRNKDDGEADLLLANLYRKNKDADNAAYYFRKGFELLPVPVDKRFSWAYLSYATLLSEQDKNDDAFQNLQKAVGLNADDDAAQYNFAVVALQLNRIDDAITAQQALHRLNSQYAAAVDEAIEKKQKSGKKRSQD